MPLIEQTAGPQIGAIRDALSQLQMAFVQARRHAGAGATRRRGAPRPGPAAGGPARPGPAPAAPAARADPAAPAAPSSPRQHAKAGRSGPGPAQRTALGPWSIA